MEPIAKFIIFTVLAIAAQTRAQSLSDPLGLPSACKVHTGVPADLAALDFSRRTAHEAVQRAWALSFERLRAVYFQTVQGSNYQGGSIDNYTTAVEQHVTAWMLGIVPLWEATRLTNPDFDIASHDGRPGLTRFSKTIVDAIELIRSKNYTASLAGIASAKQSLIDTHFPLVDVFFDGFLNKTTLSAADQTVLSCYREKTRTDIQGATVATFDGMTAVVNELSKGNTDVESVLAIIDGFATQASFHGYIEVAVKYNAIKNIYLSQYVQKVGIVRGFFSLPEPQAEFGGLSFSPFPNYNE